MDDVVTLDLAVRAGRGAGQAFRQNVRRNRPLAGVGVDAGDLVRSRDGEVPARWRSSVGGTA